MKEFNGNSHAKKDDKPEKKDIKPVVSGEHVKVAKESVGKKILTKIIAEDAKTAKNRVIDEILIPDTKRLIVKAANSLVDWIFLGKSSKPQSGVGNVSYRNYNEYSGVNAPRASFDRVTAYSVNNITFDTRGYAEEVLLRMQEHIQMYNSISIADFYQMIEQRANFTDEKYGWKNLDTAEVVRNGDRYSIQFPKIVPLV